MSTSLPSGSNPKYAWSEITGRDLPKRAPEQRLRDFHETHFPFDEATAREQASRCVQCPRPGCVISCPVGSPIQQWLELTAEGNFAEAARISGEATPIAEICARLCPRDHLCEDACILNGPAEPVSIGAIEEFLAEYRLAHGEGIVVGPANGWRVAVLGTGVAGLACASELVKRGFSVTMIGRAERAGGFLLRGTSTLRIDEAIVDRRIGMLRERGVVVRLGEVTGRDVCLSQLQSEFDAVFVGWDARRARALAVPGGDLPGVVQGTEFVGHARGEAEAGIPGVDVRGGRVVVIGEDDTAVDCARTALRRGAAEAVCVCPHPAGSLTCCRREFEDAEEEGVQFRFEETPVALRANDTGRVGQVVLTGTRRVEGGGWEAVEGVGHEIPADWVILAMGLETEPGVLEADFQQLQTAEDGALMVDAAQMTSVPGVFAGGDLVHGPSEVVIAIRDARLAAEGIEAYLKSRATKQNEPAG
ncbi:MAG: FAD-dependent oxidoreductase [Verrucomicrobiales bacterium]|nr:FAD-dependent oxidoreductase [Verrucomicrobiales bacterium]